MLGWNLTPARLATLMLWVLTIVTVVGQSPRPCRQT
jgi:hypothetical protein